MATVNTTPYMGSAFGVSSGAGGGNMGLTAEEIKEIQPYLNFDLAKVVSTTANRSPTPTYGVARQDYSSGRGATTQYDDVSKEYTSILQQIASRKKPGIYGSAGFVGQSGLGSSHAASFRPQTAPGTGAAVTAPGYSAALQRQFQIDNPGYFQLGEDPNAPGKYNRGAIGTGNTGLTQEQVYGQVKYDPKYGYIAPLAVAKPRKPDFLNKYGPYIPLLFFGAGLAATAAAGGGAAAAGGASGAGSAGGAAGGAGAGGTFSGIGAGSTTGSLGLSSAGATSGALGTTAAGGIGGGALGSGIATTGAAAGAFGIPAGGYAGAAIGANGVYGATGGLNSGAAAAGNTAGTAQQVGAPISEGVPTSTGLNPGSANPGLLSETGKLGSAVLGGGGSGGGLLSQAAGALGGGGGGYAGLISTLIGAGLSAYQAREMAKALEVQDKSTDYSRTSGGHTSFDPSIRALQDQSLAKTAEQETGVMGYGTTFRARSDENKDQYDKLYAELTSNQNPFIQARVNPLREQIAGSRGQIQRNQGLRGVGGSSFGNDELTNFDFGSSRQLGDATSQATQEALGARTGVLGSMAGLNTSTLAGNTQLTNSLNTLNSNRTGIARDRASLERAGLGLSAESEAAGRLSEQQKQEMYARLLAGLTGG